VRSHIRGANSDSDGYSYHGDHIRGGDSACSASRLATELSARGQPPLRRLASALRSPRHRPASRPCLDGPGLGARIRRIGASRPSSSARIHAPSPTLPRQCGRACWLASARSPFTQAAWVMLVKPKSWERHGLKSWIEPAKKRLHHNVLAIAHDAGRQVGEIGSRPGRATTATSGRCCHCRHGRQRGKSSSRCRYRRLCPGCLLSWTWGAPFAAAPNSASLAGGAGARPHHPKRSQTLLPPSGNTLCSYQGRTMKGDGYISARCGRGVSTTQRCPAASPPIERCCALKLSIRSFS
jgi:hypothetical protein